MLSKIISVAICVVLFYRAEASFLQCSYSASLESPDESSDEVAEKAGFICDEWPFYSGGFPKDSSSSSSSSEDSDSSDDGDDNDDDDDDDDDENQLTGTCIEQNVNNTFCSIWYSTKITEEEGCGDDDDETETEYELCFCMEYSMNYCHTWACIEQDSSPAGQDVDYYQGFKVKAINFTDSSSSSSSSEDDSDDSDDEDNPKGQNYWFAYAYENREYDWKNCWCNDISSNNEYCLNWYCETYEFDSSLNGNVDDSGWFGCYNDNNTVSTCRSWYGFLMDDEEREEYKCTCPDGGNDCLLWTCDIMIYNLRNNKMWYNFWLAFVLWVCAVGIFGTFFCYTCPCPRLKKCVFKCVCWRMATFYIIFGFVSIVHGGVPCFLFFVMVSVISMIFARRRVQKQRIVVEFNETIDGTPTIATTTINGDKFTKLPADGDVDTQIQV